MFKVKDEAQRATVYIYGTIGKSFWSDEDENRAKAFAQTLDELSPKPLDIRIDSAGGDVYEGFAIASAIQRYEGDTHVYIDGMAASAASYIALMADYVTMNDYAMIMIHNAWTLTIGNRDELRDTADRLEALDSTIAGIIAARSALDLDEVKAAMSAETWYTGDDALAAGMCDEVIETEQRMAACIDRSMAEHFKNIPEGVRVMGDAGKAAQDQYESRMDGDAIVIRPIGSAFPETATTPDGIEAEDDAGNGAEGPSHAVPTISGNEAKDAEGAFLLGNRVYKRKENPHEDQ